MDHEWHWAAGCEGFQGAEDLKNGLLDPQEESSD